MATIAHLSDLHFGRVNEQACEELRRDLLATGPDFLIVSGDLTQHGRRSEFQGARDFFASIPIPCLLIPGNHDIPLLNVTHRFLRPFKRFKTICLPGALSVIEHDAFCAIGLNSARPFGLHWNWAHGRLSRKQVDTACEVLASTPATRARLVVVHHPLVQIGELRGFPALGGARYAIKRFIETGVDIVLAGHAHRAGSRLVYTGQLSSARPFVLVQAGTATSHRLRGEGNAYNMLRISERLITVDIRGREAEGFSTRKRTIFDRANGSLREVPVAA